LNQAFYIYPYKKLFGRDKNIILLERISALKKYFLVCAVLECFLLMQLQNGFAYSNVEDGCTICHPKTKVHEITSHTTCINCHTTDSPPQGAQDVAPAKCVVCHPAGNPGTCGLVKKHVKIMKNCASCHGGTFSTAGVGIATAGPACTTCHTDCMSICPATQLLGEEDPRLETLTRFRDTVLAKSALGRKFIRMYYDKADSVNAVLENHPKLKSFSYRALASFIPIAELFM
jgi:hypothetical protein